MALISVTTAIRRVPQAANVDAEVLSDAIEEAQSLADGACKHTLESASYTDYYDIGSAQGVVSLRQFPVTGTPVVLAGGVTLVADVGYALDTASGILSGTFPAGPRNLQVIYTAGYTQATCPAGLRRVLCQIVGWLLETSGNTGATSEGQDGYNVTYEALRDGLPESLWNALQLWRKVVLG